MEFVFRSITVGFSSSQTVCLVHPPVASRGIVVADTFRLIGGTDSCRLIAVVDSYVGNSSGIDVFGEGFSVAPLSSVSGCRNSFV